MSELYSGVTLTDKDAIFMLLEKYLNDPAPLKANLSIGAYRTEDGKPFKLPSIQKAISAVLEDPLSNFEYLPMEGHPQFRKGAARFLFGEESSLLKEGRVVSLQVISGTGAVHMGGLFLKHFFKFPTPEPEIYVSTPTWPNHNLIFNEMGYKVKAYPYYDPAILGIDLEKTASYLRSIPDGSVVVLHACAHNPTGVDPSHDEWKVLADLFLEKHHFAFFDCAYQGFASGSPEKDAFSVRYFEFKGVPFLVCQSFSKNAGLYGERVGCLHLIAPKIGAVENGTEAFDAQLSVLQRSEISTPPGFGAKAMAVVFSNPDLTREWRADIETMASRIIALRNEFRDLLENKYHTPSPNNRGWGHITRQIGMFSFTGLTPAQCDALVNEHHVYLSRQGRISMPGLNPSNIDFVAREIDAVVRQFPF